MTKQNTKLSGYNPNRQPASIPSYLGLPRISGWKKFANLFKPDTPNKLKCNCLCTGRSMVEMLGVLAIIGVLSVGAIAGYSKAMFKYKLNKQTEQINQIIATMFRYKSSLVLNHNSSVLDLNITPLLIKLGEVPKEMYTSDSRILQDIFGVSYWIYSRNTSKNITLRTYSLPRAETGFQACKNLYLIAKEWHKEIALITVINYSGETYGSKGTYYGDAYAGAERKHLKDLALSELDDICRVESGNNDHYSIGIDL